MVGRTIAETNRQAVRATGSGGGARALTAPRFYESLRTRREGTRRLGHLCNDHVQDVGAGGGR